MSRRELALILLRMVVGYGAVFAVAVGWVGKPGSLLVAASAVFLLVFHGLSEITSYRMLAETRAKLAKLPEKLTAELIAQQRWPADPPQGWATLQTDTDPELVRLRCENADLRRQVACLTADRAVGWEEA